jgi:hypothetical protein
MWNGPPRYCDSIDDKGEMIWATWECDPRWIGLDDFVDEPSPLEDNNLEPYII